MVRRIHDLRRIANMKKNYLLLSIMALILPIMGCKSTQTDGINSTIKTAVNSLKYNSHHVQVKQSVDVVRPIPEGMTPEDPNWAYLPIDIHREYNNYFTYYYGDDGERAYSRQTNSIYYDLEKITGNPVEGTIRYDSSPEELFFKNQDGTVTIEEITIENKLNSYIAAIHNESNGIYSPIIFDVEFKNPFDFISYRDVQIRNDDPTKLTLINQKADFLSDCYGTVGMNFIKDNTINLDENGNIASIDFVIEDLKEETFTRRNTFSVLYSYGNTTLSHLAPFTNDNPELQAALDVLDNQKNFTYIKEYSYKYSKMGSALYSIDKDINYYDKITGYFNEDKVFFHHMQTENDEHPYTLGDNYDYQCVKQDDGRYLCYEFVPNGVEFYWRPVAISGSSLYYIDSFEGIGPTFMNMNASIFKKIGDKKYAIEEALLATSGKYFDNQMLGVNSYSIENNASKVEITLNDQGNIDFIEVRFVFENIERTVKFSIKDVGTTSVPSWADLDLSIPVNSVE